MSTKHKLLRITNTMVWKNTYVYQEEGCCEKATNWRDRSRFRHCRESKDWCKLVRVMCNASDHDTCVVIISTIRCISKRNYDAHCQNRRQQET